MCQIRGEKVVNYPKIDLKMETWVLNLPPTCILVFFQGQGRIRRGVYNLMVFDFIPPLPLPLILFPTMRRVKLQNL